MHVFELTRALIDIPSITPEEEQVGLYLYDYLSRLCAAYNGVVEKHRSRTEALERVRLLRHIPSSRSRPTWIPCRPSCLRAKTTNSSGAAAPATPKASSLPCSSRPSAARRGRARFRAAVRGGRGAQQRRRLSCRRKHPRGSKFIINGEPTENQLALGSKGALRYEVIARGKMAHSAYPELGDSAIDKLLDALEAIRKVELPVDEVLGPSTLNIGTIHGGRAPNVIPGRSARRDFHPAGRRFRHPRAQAIRTRGRAITVELNEVLEIPALRLDGGRRPAHHCGRLHHRYPGLRRRVGPAAFARPRHHPRGAHAR